MPDTREMIKYWIKSSDNDFKVMNHLFDKGHYTWSLFVGHLVVEKLLKAVYTQNLMKILHLFMIYIGFQKNAPSSLMKNKKIVSIQSLHSICKLDMMTTKWSSIKNALSNLQKIGSIP